MLYWNMIVSGGPVMWLIVLCSLLALYIFIGKWFQFHRAQVNVQAITLCDNTPGPVARILTAAIQAYLNDDDIRQAIDDAALVELPRLESRMNILATISKVAPMLGLLGTVVGMAETFIAMQMKQGISLTLGDLSGGISIALTTTAAGLCVAIPCLIAYNYLVSRVEAFCVDMEKASSEIIYFFKHHREGRDSDEN